MLPIGLAVIGAGYWGPNLVRSALATPEFNLQWLCDLDIDRARRVLGAQSTVAATSSFDEVLADPEVAAVAIATPAATHFDLVRAALEAGKHVLVEKPLTPTVDEGRKLAELADQRQPRPDVRPHLLLYARGSAHPPAHQRTVRSATSSSWTRCASTSGWFSLMSMCSGISRPTICPSSQFVLPDDVVPVAIAAHAGDPLGTGRACLAYLSVWLSNGALAHVHVNWLSPTKIRTTLFGGSRRTIVWDDINPVARIMIHDRGVDLVGAPTQHGRRTSAGRRSSPIGSATCTRPPFPSARRCRNVLAEFAGAIIERRQPLTDAAFG